MKKLSVLCLPCLLLMLPSSCIMADDAPTTTLDFPNAPVADVLAYYGVLTGQQVVCDNSVQGQISLRTSQPVAKERAEALIEEALFLNGFSLVDSEDGAILKVIGLGKAPRSGGLPVFTSAENFPKHERVVSLVINLRFVDAQKAAGWLGAYIPPTPITVFTPVGPHTLVATGTTSLLRRLRKIVEAMDVKDDLPVERKPPMPPKDGDDA